MVRIDQNSGNGQVKLTWDDVPGDLSFNLYVSKTPGAKEHGERFINVANPVTVANLEFGTKYYFVVTTVRFGAESEPSEEISYLVDK